VGLSDDDARTALEVFIAGQTGADRVVTQRLEKLSGGTIQENWAWDLSLDGAEPIAAVVRSDAVSGVGESLTRAQEFAVLEAAHAAGVTVPEPLWVCPDDAVTGRPFCVMRRVAGTAEGHRVVRDPALGGDRIALTRRLGEELARIHSIRPPRDDLGFLDMPTPDPARHAVAKFQDYLNAMPEVYPAVQWGLRWAATHAPDLAPDEIVLTHHDYRTGNLMVDGAGLTGILDWEFAGWSDRHEDMGWFFAKYSRFGANENEAGGIGPRDVFYDGYRAASGAEIDPHRVHFWEIMANVRWAVMAVQQAGRHLSGEQPSLELALTGRITPEFELEILMLTEEYEEGRVG